MSLIIPVREREYIRDPILQSNVYIITRDPYMSTFDGYMTLVSKVLQPNTTAIYIQHITGQGLKEYGCYTEFITLDYTKHMRRKMACIVIQRTWRKHRQRKAIAVIENAFLNWKTKKNERWNPHTFVGMVDLMLIYIRDIK